MKIIPSINIVNGRCVKLARGTMDVEKDYGDPLEWALRWQDEGAEGILIRDVDAAITGEFKNREVVREIIHQAKVPVKLQGGVRTREDVRCRVEDVGASLVIIGTMAIEDAAFVSWAKSVYGGDRIAVGIDAKEGKVVTRGWKIHTDVDAIDLAVKVRKMGIGTVIYTDTLRNGTMTGPNVDTAEEIVKKTWMNVQVSGGVRTIDDINHVKGTGACGAILGTALYEGILDFRDALKARK